MISPLLSTLANPVTRHGLLLLLGVLLLGTLARIQALGDLRVRTPALLALWAAAHAVYLAAAWLVTRPKRHDAEAAPRSGWSARVRPFWVVLGVAVAARLILIPVPPTLSEDVYRYLWDGRLVAHGVNPYGSAPDDPSLARFHDDLLGRLNHADIPTIYPPAAQLLFGAVARIEVSPLAFKLSMLPLEAALWIAILFLLRRRRLPDERLLLFAWSPLVLIESYGSGHVDLWAAAFLTIALAMHEAGRMAAAGAAFALAIGTKYTPLLLLPFWIHRRAYRLVWVAAAVSLCLALPFLPAGRSLWAGLVAYLAHWEFNGAAFKVLRGLGIADGATRFILAAVVAAAALWIPARARTATGAALALFTVYLLASPTVFPWYLIPLVALLPLHPSPSLLFFSGLVALSYLPLPEYHATGRWTLPDWIPWVEYGGMAAVAGLTAWRGRRKAHARREAWTKERMPT